MEIPDRPFLLLIFPGPKYDLDREFAARLGLISREFEGTVLTTGSRKKTARYGAFDIQLVPDRPLGNLRLAFHVLTWAVGRRIRGGRCDVVIAYDPLKSGMLAFFASRILNARLVSELNGDLSLPIQYVDEETGKYHRFKRFLYLKIIGAVISRCDGLKTLYPNQLAPYSDRLSNEQVVACFHDYVNLDGFDHKDEEKVVLLAGFPFLIKGVDLLIAAFKQVADRHPDWRLKILGWYPRRELLERHIDGHPRISVHPSVHHREMPEHVGRAGICVLASRTEGLPRFLIEAMKARKARIGPRVGGVPCIIQSETDGLLFESENVSELAECLDRLMGDAGLRERLADAAYARVSEFDSEAYFRHLRRFIRELLGRGESDTVAGQEMIPGSDQRAGR